MNQQVMIGRTLHDSASTQRTPDSLPCAPTAGLAGLPFCFARANPRTNHSRRHTHKWLMNNTVCECHGEEAGAGFERR
ncbi:MAG: hypothetical protein LBE85_09380 [Candidatus Accumulibacter sp.]|jgi:hypothetical protein|nr:hypothetical protein [Accumulibacter sp.]